MIPKRPFWLAMGAAVGAGSSLWIEHRVRRAVHEAADRLQPDALAVEIGRSARQIAESTSERVRSAVSVGRDEMRQQEEQLWQDLSQRRVVPSRTAPPEAGDPDAGSLSESPTPRRGSEPASGSTGRARRRRRAVPRVEATKSRSHLGN